MSELKRTVLYQAHLDAGATMVDFGGWDMPIQYPDGIVAEHLYCRSHCAIFDVSHMGRIDVEGPDMVRFLQHVLSSNVQALDLSQAQYCIIPDQNGCAIDDAYLYRFEAEKYFLVINAGNIDKDLAHLMREAERYNVTLTNVSDRYAAIAVQGPEAKKLLMTLSGGKALTRENVKNALGTLTMEGRPVRIAKTGYTGEPIGYELYCESRDARYFWDRLIELGARPTALGARDTLRMEASLPLYGHEMGECEFGGEIPVYAVPLAKFAVSFAEEKGDFIGRAALKRQFEAFQRIMNRDYSAIADLPYRIQPVYLSGKGVLRKGFPVYSKDAWAEGKPVGYVTSGTMIPYFKKLRVLPQKNNPESTDKFSLLSINSGLTLAAFFHIFIIIIYSSKRIDILYESYIRPQRSDLSNKKQLVLCFLAIFVKYGQSILKYIKLVVVSINLIS